MQFYRPALLTTLLVTPFMLTACLDDSSSGGSNGGSGSGELSLGVTDAPVDEAEAVVVRFTSVELRRADDDPVIVEFDDEQPREIDLLSLQGTERDWLFEDEEVPAGEYEQIRLHLEAEGLSDDSPAANMGTTSYILFADRPDEPSPLAVPSGLQSGLKLVSGFTVPVNGEASYTVDFDLRKAITRPEGEPWRANDYHFLRPALRLVDNTEVGHLEGEVSPDLVDANNDACEGGNAVYVFSDPDQQPQDLQNNAGDAVTTSLVTQSEESASQGTETWTYEVGFLSPGDYLVAFTCDASRDDPEVASPDVEFQAEAVVTIEAGETTRLDL